MRWREHRRVGDERNDLKRILAAGVPEGHDLPGSFQSPTAPRRADTSSWTVCTTCARRHPSAVCPFCGLVAEDGPEAMSCIQRDGPCRGCRSCFACGVEFEGRRCPTCGFPRGWMTVSCRWCSACQAVFMPHWGDHCDLFTLACARCEALFDSLCIC
jgi:hypothetical protein